MARLTYTLHPPIFITIPKIKIKPEVKKKWYSLYLTYVQKLSLNTVNTLFRIHYSSVPNRRLFQISIQDGNCVRYLLAYRPD